MRNTLKVAFSLPREDFEEIENIRHRLKVGRSAVIDRAIKFWVNWQKKQALVKQYEKGYREKPENVRDLKAWEKAGLEVFTPEAK